MKKIFLCVNYPIYNEAIGISKKIRSQIDTFRNMGYEVSYSAYTEKGIAIYKNDLVDYEYNYPSRILLSFLRRFYLMQTCAKYIQHRKYDLGYIRWDAIDKPFINALSTLKNQCEHVMMDFHGYFPNINAVGIKGHYIVFSTILNGYKLKKYVDLGLTETKNTELFGIKALTIDTGIDINKYQPHKYCGNKDELHMISVANETIYHGYDRIINGLYNYYIQTKSTSVHLHLVGKMSSKTIKLIRKLKIEQIVHLHGYKSGTDLVNIYNSCNIGIGPLAPHRVGGKEGTGIKTKEYFAIGLPYFYAGTELLVPNDYPYIFNVPADNSPIDINSILSFYGSLKDDGRINSEMRKFAEIKYSWKTIFEQAIYIMNTDKK